MRNARDIVKQILKERGITSPEDIKEYFSDSPSRTYDPFEMLNMREGVDLVMDAVDSGSRICIFGDYDADGVTSICTLYQGLSHLTDNLRWYIPSRFDEGYGMNPKAVEKLAEDGVDLIITVDCGISSVEEVRLAQQLGMEVLVTDHHTPPDKVPDCIVIDPKQEDDPYPYKGLAGCGVAFKLLQAIQRTAGLPRTVINDALDLVGAGTVGDIVPLTDENRTIVKFGLRRLNEGSRLSMRSLAEAISIKKITSENISFGIVPYINATGRMGNAGDAVELFLSDDPAIIKKQVDTLISCNERRRKVQEEAYRKCLGYVKGDEDILVLSVEGIHEGIAGIVAGNLKELLKRPVILTTSTNDGLLKGTGRSIPGVDIYELLSKYRDVFTKFGGHTSACGFTMKEENFQKLKEDLERDIREIYTEDPDIIDRDLEYDMILEPGEISMKLMDAIESMEPFGAGNPPPVFALMSVRTEDARYMGSDGTHVRFFACGEDGSRIQCVLFRRAKENAGIIEEDNRVNITGTLRSQIWNGERRLQFIVEEIESGERKN